MKISSLLLILFIFLAACKNKKQGHLADYNDRIVNMIEEADITMKTWNNSDIMQNYEVNKEAAKNKITGLQDSIKKMQPNGKDDTLRIAGISVLTSYLQAFSIYDTIFAILSDSLFLKEDSVRVQNLLQTNKNLIEQQSTTFGEIQKRFAGRYELDFMQ